MLRRIKTPAGEALPCGGGGRGNKGVELYGRLRHAVQIEGLSHREAARRFGIDPRCSASTILSGPDNHLGSFEAARVGVLFAVLAQFSPSFWLSLMVVAGISS